MNSKNPFLKIKNNSIGYFQATNYQAKKIVQNQNTFQFSNSNNQNALQITIKVQKRVNYGEAIYIVGNFLEIGEWEISRAFRMAWTQNHIWVAKIKLKSNFRQENLEYRYFIANFERNSNQSPYIIQKEYGWNTRKVKLTDNYFGKRQILTLDKWNQQKLIISVESNNFLEENINNQRYFILGNCNQLGSLKNFQNLKKVNHQNTFQIEIKLERKVEKIYFFLFKAVNNQVYYEPHFGHFTNINTHKHRTKTSKSISQSRSPRKMIFNSNSSAQDGFATQNEKYYVSTNSSKASVNTSNIMTDSQITASQYTNKSHLFQNCQCDYPKGFLKINCNPAFQKFIFYEFCQIQSGIIQSKQKQSIKSGQKTSLLQNKIKHLKSFFLGQFSEKISIVLTNISQLSECFAMKKLGLNSIFLFNEKAYLKILMKQANINYFDYHTKLQQNSNFLQLFVSYLNWIDKQLFKISNNHNTGKQKYLLAINIQNKEGFILYIIYLVLMKNQNLGRVIQDLTTNFSNHQLLKSINENTIQKMLSLISNC